jgi:hypothetical protein
MISFAIIVPPSRNKCRSQWPRVLRHELSSLARTLGSCVRIPLKACMSVLRALFRVCVVLCVDRGLATGWSLVQGILPTVYRIKILKRSQGPTNGCRAIIIIIIIIIISQQMNASAHGASKIPAQLFKPELPGMKVKLRDFLSRH